MALLVSVDDWFLTSIFPIDIWGYTQVDIRYGVIGDR